MKIAINEYAPSRALGFKRWFPEAVVCKRYEQEKTPDSFDLLILSGGPMSADEKSRSENVFLAEDMILLKELQWLGKKSPFVLGVCLGAQLMVFANGGDVQESKELIVGWNELTVKHQHLAFTGMANFLVCEIHRNHIAHPGINGQILVSSQLDSIEAFSIGSRFLGTAYHPEITKDDAERISDDSGGKLKFKFLSDSDKVFSLSDAFMTSKRFFENIRTLV